MLFEFLALLLQIVNVFSVLVQFLGSYLLVHFGVIPWVFSENVSIKYHKISERDITLHQKRANRCLLTRFFIGVVEALSYIGKTKDTSATSSAHL